MMQHNNIYQCIRGGGGSLVSMATRVQAGWSRVRIPVGASYFSFL